MALDVAGFSLSIRSTETLFPHEQTIQSHVESLAKEMQRDGVQKDPLIVDRDSGTILDGMHRLAAFSRLGISRAACCSVDYGSSSVTLSRWARVYTLPRAESYLSALQSESITRRVSLADALEEIEHAEVGLAVLTSDAAFLPTRTTDLMATFELVLGLDSISEEQGWKRDFVPEDDLDISLQEKRNIVVLVRKLSKEDVVSAAKNRRLFPCKTSLHRIDPRPVAVNFPLAELNFATTEALRDRLKERQELLLPSGSIYGGRRYKERLLLLNPV
ncbi:MAG TPA: ParB N-terminal domain-containing protein [Nitrososphaerales archaeon]|nr:ParB N-terminal domain-containing protein [Nitrososphaerales archaeon]